MAEQKRVLIVTQYYYPENFRINDLGPALVKKGYHVDALVSIPNYPEGKYFKGYGIFKKRVEKKDGVKIYRVFQLPRGKKASNVRLSLNYISYAMNAVLWVLFYFAWKKKYDAIIAYEPSPITLIIPAIVLGKIRKTKVLSWIQDIFPDSITDNTSERANKILIPILGCLTEWIYRNSDKILISSKGMAELVNRKKDYSEKIEYTPNWCSDFKIITDTDIPELPTGFKIMMAGNLGEGIGPEEVCQCVEELKDLNDIHFVFVGSGSRKDFMEQWFKEHDIHNAVCLGRFPVDKMPAFFAQADAMLLALKKTEFKHLDVTVPARVQSYLSAGKPVFAMIGSGATEVIETANCGVSVQPGDYKKLAKKIREVYKEKELLEKWGNNARDYYEQVFTVEKGVEHFEKLIGP